MLDRVGVFIRNVLEIKWDNLRPREMFGQDPMHMVSTTLQDVADAVVRRAQRQGYVVPREIRSELKQAGWPEEQWKDVVNLARQSLNCRQGRYYHITALSPRLQQEQTQQRLIHRAIKRLIRCHEQSASPEERRQQDRVDFIEPVTVQMEDGRRYTLLSRDLSPTGIRLVGTRRLLGQKVQITVPQGEDAAACTFVARILWTCAIGDDLFENGGTFLEILSPPAQSPRPVSTTERGRG